MNSISYYFYYLDAQFYGYPLIIRITVIVVMLLMFLYIFSLSRIFVVYRRIRKEEKRRSKVKEKYESLLNEILYSSKSLSVDNIQSELEIKGKSLKSWEKKYFTDLLIDVIKSRK